MKTIHIEPKPYLMRNPVQHYEWGTRNRDAFIPQFLGIPPEPGRPYAELWMGGHPKAPSSLEIEGRAVPLNEAIDAHPIFCLGSGCLDRFGKQLPFLFKVLSIAEPLSIQAHPDKQEAERLHKRDPKHYPDDNHKPEIAIALESLTALVGLKSPPDMQRIFAEQAEIGDFLGGDTQGPVENLFKTFLQTTVSRAETYAQAVSRMAQRLRSRAKDYSLEERLFLAGLDKYGTGDAGLFAVFFLQPVTLAPGEGVFLDACVPHAYIEGTIVECMANSDNVVRVGLTPKFKDVDTLVSIVQSGARAPVMHPDAAAESFTYPVQVPDFQISRSRLASGDRWAALYGDRPEVLLVTRGRISIRGGDGTPVTLSRGNSAFIPALLERYIVQVEADTELFHVTVPEQ